MKSKKAQFQAITQGMIAFIAFVLVVATALILITQTKQMGVVCGGTYLGQNCLTCNDTAVYSVTNATHCCKLDTLRCEAENTSTPEEYGGAAYNVTKKLQTAAGLPAEFSQIIMLVLIIIGVLSILAVIGYTAYQKMR